MADEPITPLKACTKCGSELPATTEHFNRQKQGKFGLRAKCRSCTLAEQRDGADYFRQRNRENYLKNRESIRAAARLRLAEPDVLEAQKKRQRDWYAANKKRHREVSREWCQQNKASRAASRQRMRAADPERVRGYWRKRNDLLLSLGRLEGRHIQEQLTAQSGSCFYCQSELGGRYDVDHFIPLSRGGTNCPTNIRIACPSCNRSKGAKMPWEWQPKKFKENTIG